MNKRQEFLRIAKKFNEKLNVLPVLYGSLGLEERLGIALGVEDVDVLIPEKFLNEKWRAVVELMNKNGYRLYDLHEHAFEMGGVHLAFAATESLVPFAGVDLTKIPVMTAGGAEYFLLDLQDYLKVYTASGRDSYRRNIKNKQDRQKADLIKAALSGWYS